MTDGLQVELGNDDMIHFPASGNAPELRCYNEAAKQQQVDALVQWRLNQAATLAES